MLRRRHENNRRLAPRKPAISSRDNEESQKICTRSNYRGNEAAAPLKPAPWLPSCTFWLPKTKWEFPRLCRGGSQCLTYPGIVRALLIVSRPRQHDEENTLDKYESLNHSVWDCKYHVVFIPKYRKKQLYGHLRAQLGEVFRKLAAQRESRIEEGHLMSDHVHMLIAIPPKYAVAQVVGFIKGKSAIHIARTYMERKRNFVGQHFWARGYFVSTVGRDEEVVREYIRRQEAEDRRIDQLNLV